MRLSKRSNVDAFIVMDVLDAAAKAEAEGRHIIHMEVGQPGTSAPHGARKALSAAMETDSMGYTVALGIPPLRAKIADLYRTRHGLSIDPDRVVVTSGSSGAFLLAFTALFDAGDRVALGAPGYPSLPPNPERSELAGGRYTDTAQDRYQPRPSDIPNDVHGLIVASPAIRRARC